MPFAQRHYPFENKEIFAEQFPADFICEGIDQTRGWFYSLLVIGTFLTARAPYKNVLVNDLILDAKGLKMSKSKGNTVNPFELFDKYGADALRWYLLYVSPAWTPTKFDENGLKEVISKFFNTYKNVYAFFALYANTDGMDPRDYDIPVKCREDIDRWLISKYNSLIKSVRGAIDEYDMTRAVRAIQDFVNEDLSNWYIRRNRKRFWGSELSDDKKAVYLTTYEVLCGISKLAAPFAPFITEEIYRDLTGAESVHLVMYPSCREEDIDQALENKMDTVRALVSLGRGAREEAQIKVRQPIAAVHIDGSLKELIGDLTGLIKEELNVKEVVYESDLSSFMDFAVKPDFKICGKELGSKVKTLDAYLKNTDAAVFIKALRAAGNAEVILDGEKVTLTEDMLDIRISARAGFDVQTQDNLFIIINTELTPELIAEGYARELISKVQQLRKTAGYEVADRIALTVEADADIKEAITRFEDYIKAETLSQKIEIAANDGEPVELNGHRAVIKTVRIQ